MTLESPPIVTTSSPCRLQLGAKQDLFGAARRIVRANPRLWGRAGLVDAAGVCVTETPAHVNPADCELVLGNMREGVRAAVRDQSTALPVVVEEADRCAESGRGAFIVVNTADLWATSPIEGGGKQVWALLRAGA
ncbi:ATP-binding protein [Streptomyces sp. RPT161]|uniref:ATP-binding protein n=1 Tax=Streptomyces sp. RPT161 TaxID=3015993 RepID=UPI0022B8770C|nr:ATP-binding protein [Streptomyces sp. RPT161]